MKVVLDLSKLLDEGKITQTEYDRFSQFALQETGSLAFNLLVAFGVIAVSCASIAMLPTAMTAIVVGVIVCALGLGPLRFSTKWGLLSQICVLIGAFMLSGGILWLYEGSVMSWVIVTVLMAVGGILIRHGLLVVLSVLALSAAVGAATGYEHAMYRVAIEQPAATIVLFTILAYATFKLSLVLDPADQHLAMLASRTSIFLVNMGFWIGSLWGDTLPNGIRLPALSFIISWALLLLAVGTWASNENRRWVLNICAVFGAIHFYSQWFERLGAKPWTVLVAGLLALAFAMGIKQLNTSENKLRKIRQ